MKILGGIVTFGGVTTPPLPTRRTDNEQNINEYNGLRFKKRI